MKEIKLTQGKVALVDDEDFDRINQFKWCAHWNGRNWYARRDSSRRNGKQSIYMHRYIMNATKGVQVDHRNGNGLDNQKSNMRNCTNQENNFNKKYPNKNNKLGIKGVSWIEKRKKFKAVITVNGKSNRLGCFNVMGDADSAYRIAEEKYFREFARKD